MPEASRLLEEGDLFSSVAIDSPGTPKVQHSRDAVEKIHRTSGGHTLHWHQVSLPFGMLQMTMLLESCARGEEARVAVELERFKGLGQAVLEAELAATDDWAVSSPLHWAAYAGSAACVHMLVEAGARHTATSRRDSSQPLHLAARFGHQAAARALLEHGAEVDAVNARGNTALHECCAKVNSSGVVETLLRARASLEVYNDPDSGDRRMTPLLVAAEAGSLAAIRLLLQRGADPQAFVHGASVNPVSASQKNVWIDHSKLLARNVMQALGRSGCGKNPSSGAEAATPISPTVHLASGAEAATPISPTLRPASEAEAVTSHGPRFPWSRAADFLGAIYNVPYDEKDAAQQHSGEPQIKLQAVHVALAKGNLLCVAELLEWFWRAQGQARARAQWPATSLPGPPLDPLVPRAAQRYVPERRVAYVTGRWGASDSRWRRSSPCLPSPSSARSGLAGGSRACVRRRASSG